MPVNEEEILHQYFGAIFYDKKKTPDVYVGKVLRRFLNDEQRVASALEFDGLKKKHGVTNNILEVIPEHLE